MLAPFWLHAIVLVTGPNIGRETAAYWLVQTRPASGKHSACSSAPATPKCTVAHTNNGCLGSSLQSQFRVYLYLISSGLKLYIWMHLSLVHSNTLLVSFSAVTDVFWRSKTFERESDLFFSSRFLIVQFYPRTSTWIGQPSNHVSQPAPAVYIS